MNTKQIEYIIELSQTLNFNRAAENLYISQPTLTYQIKAVESELGFSIFARSGKGATLTPAGAQFVASLRAIQQNLHAAIEQGQNFSARFREDIRIAMPIRSAIYFLPQAISQFNKSYPDVSITPYFDWKDAHDSFLRGEQDVLFAMDYTMNRIPNVTRHPLFDSRFYLITEKDDPLAQKERITNNDLKYRTLMVGGGSPPVLRSLQQQLIQEQHLNYFNSHDHDTTLTNVAAHRGICIAPGFLNDHSHEFAWIPFDTSICLPCSIFINKNDQQKHLIEFITLLQSFYINNPKFPI